MKQILFPPLLVLLLLGLSHGFLSHPPKSVQNQWKPALAASSASSPPSSPSDRESRAISSIQKAVRDVKIHKRRIIECEFPALAALNKLGDGTLRSTMEAEDANLSFAVKVVRSLSPPFAILPGPKARLVTGTAAPGSFLRKCEKLVPDVHSLRDGLDVPGLKGDDVIVICTPSSRQDFTAAASIARGGRTVVIINAFAKDQKSIEGKSALMAYYLKPLTYNSQVAGFLVRAYPNDWTTADVFEKKALGVLTDKEILVPGTNTPDLRASGRLVQKNVDQRALRERGRA